MHDNCIAYIVCVFPYLIPMLHRKVVDCPEKCLFSIDVPISFLELARKPGDSDKTKVGNMVVKAFLKRNGVELEKFSSHTKSYVQAPRRQLNKTFGGDISTPVPRTS